VRFRECCASIEPIVIRHCIDKYQSMSMCKGLGLVPLDLRQKEGQVKFLGSIFTLNKAGRLAALCFMALLAACSNSVPPGTPGSNGGGGGGGGDSGGGSNIAVTGVSVNKPSLSLAVGSSDTITATVFPDTATNKKVTWKSSAPEVATVNGSGRVTAVALGDAIITVTTDDGQKTISIPVAVSSGITSVTPLSASHGAIVTIKGVGFGGTPEENSVAFGSVPVKVTNVEVIPETAETSSSMVLTVEVPKNLAASGNVRVTVGKQTAVSTATFTYVPIYVVSTLAGSNTASFADGVGTAAIFNHPEGVAVDATGKVLYVADTGNHRIRSINIDDTVDSGDAKVKPFGMVETFAGSGEADFFDDIAIAAKFRSPAGVTVDTAGNVYVADTGNHRIRKIDKDRVVSTFKGDGTAGFVDSVADLVSGGVTPGRFNSPRGIAVIPEKDADGNVSNVWYVADTGNHSIRRITINGGVATFAGSEGKAGFLDDTSKKAQFDSPAGIAVDAAYNVYVADRGNNRIRRVTPPTKVTLDDNTVVTLDGTVKTFAGEEVEGSGVNSPYGVAVDAKYNVYIADTNNNRIRKDILTNADGPSGLTTTVSTLAGTGASTPLIDDTTPLSATFNAPHGVAFYSVTVSGVPMTYVYIADTDNNRIRRIAPE
jgi:sugar lactone lactonase YvrE